MLSLKKDKKEEEDKDGGSQYNNLEKTSVLQEARWEGGEGSEEGEEGLRGIEREEEARESLGKGNDWSPQAVQ